VPDPTADGMLFALITPGTYLDFAEPVAFVLPDGLAELGLFNEQGRISGRAQAAVRSLSASDFRRITSRGLDDTEWLLPRDENGVPDSSPLQFDEEQSTFIAEEERFRVAALTSRIVRKRVFRKVVLRAYDERCAVTGLKLINGGGRAEVDAAHIRPVRTAPTSSTMASLCRARRIGCLTEA
jgi:putative restriction endonuclease